MKRLLVVVDMQNDFIDGSLGTKEATMIVEPAAKYIEEAISQDVTVVFTRDTHYSNYLETQEGKKLPVVHCIKDEAGWQICDRLSGYTKERKIFDKPTFGSTELADYIKENEFEEITLLGLCTDICVISNAMLAKAALPEAVVKVVANASAGVTPESHNNALEAMKMCQIEII